MNANAGDPHYEPTAQQQRPIRPGDLVLLDMWAKLATRRRLLRHHLDRLLWRRSARERSATSSPSCATPATPASGVITEALAAGPTVRGCEVDDAVRGHIRATGYGHVFVHRTGHSIGERSTATARTWTTSRRTMSAASIPGTCFSIEPGIYLPEFGVRSEVNVLIEDRARRVTGEIQRELLLL